MAKRFTLAGLLVLAAAIVVAQGSGTPSTLRVKTDANHALLVSNGGAQTPPITTSTFNNTRLATDVDGNLLVVGSGGGGIVGGTCPTGFVVAIDTAGVPTCSFGTDSVRLTGTLGIGSNESAHLGTVATDIIDFYNHGTSIAIAWDLRTFTLGAGWGAGAAISAHSNQSLGQVTLGTAPSATTLVVSTDSSMSTPQCFVQNSSVPSLLQYAYDSGSGDFTITGTGFVAGNVIEWMCNDRRGP